MEGRRLKRDLPVSASVDEAIGMASYMQIDTLNQLTGEGAVVSAAELYVEPSERHAMLTPTSHTHHRRGTRRNLRNTTPKSFSI